MSLLRRIGGEIPLDHQPDPQLRQPVAVGFRSFFRIKLPLLFPIAEEDAGSDGAGIGRVQVYLRFQMPGSELLQQIHPAVQGHIGPDGGQHSGTEGGHVSIRDEQAALPRLHRCQIIPQRLGPLFIQPVEGLSAVHVKPPGARQTIALLSSGESEAAPGLRPVHRRGQGWVSFRQPQRRGALALAQQDLPPDIKIKKAIQGGGG